MNVILKGHRNVSLPIRWSTDKDSNFLRLLTQTLLTSNEASNRRVKWLATHGRAHVLRPYYAYKIRPSWARVYLCVFVYVCVCACAWPFYWILLNSNLVWIQYRASARREHRGGLNNLTLLLAWTAQSPVRSNNKFKLFRLVGKGFCDTTQASAQLTRYDKRVMWHQDTEARKQSGTQLKNY